MPDNSVELTGTATPGIASGGASTTACRKDLALFDFDGTLTTREMLPDFFRRAIPRRRLCLGQVLLAPLIVGYKLGWVPGTVVRAAIVRVGLAGLPLVDYRRHGEAFANEVLPGVLRVDAMARLRWHQARGDTVVVVSGAFDVYLEPWCRQHGVALICSALEHDGQRLTGRYLGPQCVRAEKPARVVAAYDLARFERVHAYGDTVEDLDLLAIAHHRYYRGEELTA
jgi:phosphatidylglycerophosphatase C